MLASLSAMWVREGFPGSMRPPPEAANLYRQAPPTAVGELGAAKTTETSASDSAVVSIGSVEWRCTQSRPVDCV
jgi:hypothetical protein